MFLPTVAEAMLLVAKAALLHAEAALLDAEAMPLHPNVFISVIKRRGGLIFLLQYLLELCQRNYIHMREGSVLQQVVMMIIRNNVFRSCNYCTVNELVIIRICLYNLKMIEWCDEFHERAIHNGLYN